MATTEPQTNTTQNPEQTVTTKSQTSSGEETTEQQEQDWKAQYEQMKAHFRTWEDRAKANKAAAEELEQLKEAQKTEAQKLAEKMAELEKQNAAYKQREDQAAWAKEIAAETKVPADLLPGSTREEMQDHAEQLAAHFTPSEPASGTDPHLNQTQAFGKTPASTPATLSDMIAAAEKAGDRSLVASLKASQLGTTHKKHSSLKGPEYAWHYWHAHKL